MSSTPGQPRGSGKSSATPEIADLRNELKKVNYMMVAVIVVLFIGFFGGAVALGGILVDGYRSREVSYGELANKVQTLLSTLNQNETSNLQGQIDDLRKKNPYLK